MNDNKNYQLSNFWHFLATGFGSSFIVSKFSGTIATGIGIIFWLLIVLLPLYLYLLFIIISIILGCYCCQKTSEDIGIYDHNNIVWDEFVGIWIALFQISISDVFYIILCFVIFRILDIWKPWPIGWLEQIVKGGVGIMLDDIIAGLMTMIIVHYLYYLLK